MKLKKLLPIIVLGAAISASATRIAILSDIHVTPGNECDTKLRQAVAEINQMNDVDFVVVNGDLTNEGSDEQIDNVKSILDGLTHPQYLLPGNHENNWSQSATKKFKDTWGDDRFVVEKDSLIVIGINCGPFMKMGDGHVKQEDLHWLKATLQRLYCKGKRVVSFNHYPLQDDLDNYRDYAAILEQYPTIIHINGHYHKNEPYRCGDIECMMVRSLDRRKGDFGYTLMDVTRDSVLFYQKRLGQEAERIHGVAAKAPVGKLSDLSPSLPPHDVALPASWKLTKVWTDSASIFTRLGLNDGLVAFGNSLGEVKLLNAADGSLVWTTQTGASLFSRPVITGKAVIVPSADRQIRFLDRRDGHQLSSQPSQGPYVADGLLDGDNLYQGGYKKFEMWDVNTGQQRWLFDSIGNYCQASPTLAGDKLLFGAWDTYLYCLSRDNGQMLWKWNNGKTANMLGPGNVVPVVSGDKVIIVAPDRYMTAIDLNTGATLWRDNSHRYRESLGVSQDTTTAYAKTMDGELVAVDLTTPEFSEKWVIDMGLGYEHAPCIVAEKDGIVYTGSRRGVLTAIYPASPTIVGQVTLGSSEINGIDVDPLTGDIWVSLIEGTVWRLSRH